MDSTRNPFRLTPLTISGAYLVLGLAGLVFSDLLLPSVLDGAFLRDVQAAKGAAEVAVTAGLIYGLVRYSQRSLRRANERLERNDQVLQVLLRLLRHNIRNEMNVIQGYAETARSDATEQDVEASCDAILTTAEDLLDRTETVNELRSMLDGTTETHRFDPVAVVRGAAARYEDVDGVEVSVSGTDVPAVEANSLLPEAVAELVDNAVRHGHREVTSVELSAEGVDGDVAIRVLDDGPGIPETELQVLEQHEESPLTHSSGLGLWFVYWVVEDAGGEVSIERRESGGTAVTLELRAAAESGALVEAALL